MKNKKIKIVEKHKILAVEPIEEIYPYTKQKMIRPNVKIVRAIFLAVLLIVGLIFTTWGILELLALTEWYEYIPIPWGWQFTIVYILSLIISLLLLAKTIAIFIIRIYQKYAPYEVRCTCLYIPNCSEYMILAIKKYGLIKGIKKGKSRLARCNEPNGGEDYP